MAGIPGQPSPKPSQLPPQPGTIPEGSALNDYKAPKGSALDTYSMGEAGASQDGGAVPEAPGQFPGAGLVQGALDALPAAGGMAGAVAGFGAGGPLGMVAGAGAGGVAGESLRQTLQAAVFGNKGTRADLYGQLGQSGLNEATGAAFGESLGPIAQGIAKSKFGKAAGQFLEQVKGPIQMVRDAVQEVRDGIEEPLLKVLNNKATSMNTEQAGDAAKQLLTENIKQKHGPFVQAYSDLNAVSQAMPLADEARYKFTQGTKKWALDSLSGDNYRVVGKFMDQIDSANTGAQLDDVIKNIGDAKNTAYNAKAYNLSNTLKELQSRAQGFFEGETTKLAARIQGGKATPEEMNFLQTLAQQRGIQEADPTKYAKSIAKDYLTGRDKVRSDYANFRSFLSDVGEQTKIRAENQGPMAFLSEINDVPSEKLIERMFDPKNAAALRRMQSETPEVFDTVVRSKMSQIMQQASPDGQIDLAGVRKILNRMPESTRNMLMNSEEMKTMHAVLDNPRLERLKNIDKMGQMSVLKWAADLGEVARITGAGAVKSGVGVMQNPAGATAVGSALTNAISPSAPQEPQ